jgi:hypothetical protein
VLLCIAGASGARAANVITHHNDTLRTGWNDDETLLTASAVGSGAFGLLHQVPVDNQVDAQPLLVTGLTINGSVHDVVYAATEGNSIYAIDASTGAILLRTNLGAPVPMSKLPGGCNNDGPNIGINSTPVIDTATQTLYVMAYESIGSSPQYTLHALELATLADKIAPVQVSASHTLSDGTTVYDFNASFSHQRAALLEADGNIYAAFGSFCDVGAKKTRGWLLGWSAATLAPLAASQLTNQVLPGDSPDDYFLTSIWMSGAGPAWAGTGNIFFVTGNADKSGTTYDDDDGVNLSESVVEVTPALSAVYSYFSPTDPNASVAVLDQKDLDFGAGGVMLLPDQPGSGQWLAVAAGKVGIMYLMNREYLGGENSGNALGEYSIGRCWCTPSYFVGPDGVGRVVSSGGNTVKVWQVRFTPDTALAPDPGFAPPSITTGQTPGFFTSISSNGTAAGSAVIWAVNRPFDSGNDVSLFAYDAANGALLYSGTAGTWPNTSASANLVPTVANGHVYVGSYKSVAIFGLATGGKRLLSSAQFARPDAPVDAAVSVHEISGFVRAAHGSRVTIETRDGKAVAVDLTEAKRNDTAVRPVVGDPVLARGDFVRGVLRADSFLHAKPHPSQWRPDR